MINSQNYQKMTDPTRAMTACNVIFHLYRWTFSVSSGYFPSTNHRVQLYVNELLYAALHCNQPCSRVAYWKHAGPITQKSVDWIQAPVIFFHFISLCTVLSCILLFGRPYYRSSLWYSVSSVCLSVVCNVLYCGKTVRSSEKVSEGVNRKPGQKVHFLGRRHISTSGFAATDTETAVFALFLPVQPSDRY